MNDPGPNVPTAEPPASAAPAPRWQELDTVLLDMDGTLLDLRFDNEFWRQRVPEAWGAARGIHDPQQAQAALRPRFEACAGTLDWYCVDYWTRELALDITALKRAHAHGIRWLEGAPEFLQRVRGLGKRLVLLTNAHPTTLSIKDSRTGVVGYFDASFSSHQFGAPKEDERFWQRLGRSLAFDPARCLFVDDSLPVLRAARAAGIGSIYAVRRPDSSRAARVQDEFPAVDAMAQLL